jgi:hypothetical protein
MEENKTTTSPSDVPTQEVPTLEDYKKLQEQLAATEKELTQAKFNLGKERIENKVNKKQSDMETVPEDNDFKAELENLKQDLAKRAAMDAIREFAPGDMELQSAIYKSYTEDIRLSGDINVDVRKAFQLVGGAKSLAASQEQVRSALSQKLALSPAAPSSTIPTVEKKTYSQDEIILAKALGVDLDKN